MTDSRPSPMLGEQTMLALRNLATEHEPDTIAVIVLAGSEERGLGLSVSTALDTEEETLAMLAYAITANPIVREYVTRVEQQ